MARLSWRPTSAERNQVQAMAAYGVPEDKIADVLGISAPTLRKHCRKELDTGATTATSQVAEFLYTVILGKPDPRNPGERIPVLDGHSRVTAAIFWLKTRGGWKETVEHEHANKGGLPFVFQVSATDAKL